MEITETMQAVFDTATKKGFWDAPDFAVNTATNAESAHAIKQAFLSQKLMLVVSELGEALEALRNDHFADLDDFEDGIKVQEERFGHPLTEKQWREYFSEQIKNTFEDELADAVIRIFDLAAKMNIDLEWHLQQKMQYNGMRPYKHGRNF